MRRIQHIILLMTVVLQASAQSFVVAKDGKRVNLIASRREHAGVLTALSNLGDDIELAYSGEFSQPGLPGSILVGTIGRSQYIDGLVEQGKLDVTEVKGQWESYVIDMVDGNLVIAGSDRRGTIYGIYEISRRLGVSPWTWWADVPVKKQKVLEVSAKRFVKKSPAVKYRGIFINDEDWGMKPWATQTFEKELGDIGPKTYEKVCELILRLGGNMLAPAMHTCTGAFYTHPESKVVCDRMGVIITTSHCEPMLFNNASKEEWDSECDGEWNYRTNRNTILKKFTSRLAEAAQYDNIYTVAMRGVHDEGMRGQTSPQERVKVLEDVIRDQRTILELFTQKPAREVPQIFVPYKETLDVYNAGLRLPDDVTIVWPDDNYGFMKHLPTAEERKRSGGNGVYYHLSYCGTPHDYLWLNTTPPALMLEELGRAYKAGADRYWLLNVGDIKPMELGMQLFFDMADDPTVYDYEKVNTFQANMLADIYGVKYQKELQDIITQYYHLAWERKPEYVGWDWQWDSDERCRLRDSEYSFQHYNQAQRRLARYHDIAQRTMRIMEQLPSDYRASFFEFIGYPVMASEQMSRKFLLAQLNHEQYKAGNKAEANWAADESQAAFDSIEALNLTYNTMLDGKWNGMMMVPPGFVSLYPNMPELNRTQDVAPKPVNLSLDKAKDKMEGCLVLNVAKPASQDQTTLIPGLGYEGTALQFGEGTSYASYNFAFPKGEMPDSITAHIYMMPFFPEANPQKSNTVGISIDGQKQQTFNYKFEEWSYPWKEDVMRNGHEYVVRLKVGEQQKNKNHMLTVFATEGQVLQRIVLDWGGLQQAYLYKR